MSEDFDIDICDDCLMVAANGAMGDGSEIPSEILHNPDADAGGILTPTCDGESDYTSFSWSPCDWCRRPLGGSRHAAVVTYSSSNEVVEVMSDLSDVEFYSAVHIDDCDCRRDNPDPRCLDYRRELATRRGERKGKR